MPLTPLARPLLATAGSAPQPSASATAAAPAPLATVTSKAAPGAPSPASAVSWCQAGSLRGHCDDVLDLAWAPDGSALASGGVENAVFVWNVEGRKSLVGRAGAGGGGPGWK